MTYDNLESLTSTFKRTMKRLSKRAKGQELTLDDLSTVVAGQIEACRTQNDKWNIYQKEVIIVDANLAMPMHTGMPYVTLKRPIAKEQDITSALNTIAQRPESTGTSTKNPYNHMENVAKMIGHTLPEKKSGPEIVPLPGTP